MNTLATDNVVSTFTHEQISVITHINSTLKMKIQGNKQRLIAIVETILLCARQEIPFWGTNDSRPIDVDGIEPDWNYGNFRALLRMCAKRGDMALKRPIAYAPLNALYTCSTTQN
ncbi:hypothetical protein PR048_013682 [Dryococelus australis]|uniref:Uncharacterized protein n=1 Tax=Dryococelus australis TaxID=614101 RepID=A0ABQ9HTA7_9NEOP|nr:hypothetical protein PR048_013682 [Dryococelus australis]